MRLNDFPLTTLQGLGRRRLWWTRRPTRATSATAVATNATAVGGQSSRPQVSTLAFQIPALPGLAPAARLAVAFLGLGLILGVAGALRGAVADRRVRHFASAPLAGGPAAAPSVVGRRPLAGVGANGAWFGPGLRPRALGGDALSAPLRTLPEEGAAYALPGGVLPPARLATEWELQARLYAAAWVGTRDALLPPTLRGRNPVASHSVASRAPGLLPAAGAPTAPTAGQPGLATAPQLRRRALPLQSQPQWRPLRRSSRLQWRI